MDHTRRLLLTAIGAGAVPGCAATDGGSGETADTNPNGYPVITRSIGNPVTTDKATTVTVSNPRLQKAVVVDQHTSPVQMADNLQWVVFDVVVENSTDETKYIGGDFQILTDGTPAKGRSASLQAEYHPSEKGRPVGAPVAIGEAATSSIAWVRGLPQSVLWSLPESLVSDLSNSPSFVVEDVIVGNGEDPTVTLRIRNEGSRDGTFYANISGSQVEDGNAIMAVDVSAGETVTRQERPGIVVAEDTETRVTIRWGTDRVVRTVRA